MNTIRPHIKLRSMLREDKSVRIERVELTTDAEKSAINEVSRLESEKRTASWELNELELELLMTEADVPLSFKFAEERLLLEAERAHKNEVAQVKKRVTEATMELDDLNKAISVAVANLDQFSNQRIPGRRVRGKDHRIVDLTEDEYQAHAQDQNVSPVLFTTGDGGRWWWYLDRFWRDSEGLDADDVQALVLQRDKKKQATLDRARADAFGNTTTDEQQLARRAPIPESVRHEVWRRDQGRCVDCGSRENLEFDHIIPFIRGGSNTARNLELRCETCNRRKGARI